MKQFVRFGAFLTVCAFAALAVYSRPAYAQKDRSAHADVTHRQSGTELQWSAQSDDGKARGEHDGRTVITVRKFKPRSTQPTWTSELFRERRSITMSAEPNNAARTVLNELILNSTLIIPVLELKKFHTVYERKIFSVLSYYPEIHTA